MASLIPLNEITNGGRSADRTNPAVVKLNDKKSKKKSLI
jgi:hypothetical protein